MRRGCCCFLKSFMVYLKEARLSRQERHPGVRRSLSRDCGEAPSGQPSAKDGKIIRNSFWSKRTGRKGRPAIPSRPLGSGGDGERDGEREQGRGQGHEPLPPAACPRTADFVALRLWVGSKGDTAAGQGSVIQVALGHPPIRLGGANPSRRDFFQRVGMDPAAGAPGEEAIPGRNPRAGRCGSAAGPSPPRVFVGEDRTLLGQIKPKHPLVLNVTPPERPGPPGLPRSAKRAR